MSEDSVRPRSWRDGGGKRGGGVDGREGAGDDAREEVFVRGDFGVLPSGVAERTGSRRWMREEKKPDNRLDARTSNAVRFRLRPCCILGEGAREVLGEGGNLDEALCADVGTGLEGSVTCTTGMLCTLAASPSEV